MAEQRSGIGATGIIVSAIWVVGLAMAGKALGLLKDVVIASRFGTSAEMDAYLVAFTIPAIIVHWFRAPIRAGFVPLFSEALEQKGEKEAWRSAGVFLGDFLVLVLIIAVVAIVAAPWIVAGVAPGFDAQSQALTTGLVRIMLVSLVFAAANGVASNLLHIHGNFALPGVSLPIRNLVLIAAAILLTATHGIRGLAYGMVVSGAVSTAIMWPAVRRIHRDIRLRIDFTNPMFLGVMRLALPLLIGMAGAKLDDVIDRVFASMLSEGSISGLGYALRLIDLPKEILIVAFSTVLFPVYARMAARGQHSELGDRLIDSVRLAFFILLPVSIGMAMLGDPFVRLIYQRGAFGEPSVQFTVSAMLLYTPTIWALGLTTIMTAGFIALKDTKTPVIAGFIRLGVKIGLVFLFIRTFEHAGIALATSVSHVFKLILFLFLLPPVLREGRYRKLMRGFAGTAVSTGAMAIALHFAVHAVGRGAPGDPFGHRLAVLVGLALLGAGVYATTAGFVARDELRETVQGVRLGVVEFVRRGTRRGSS